jgi:hypothetical protein
MRLEFQRFVLGYIDIHDPIISNPVLEWESSEQGQWVMEHAQNLTYFRGHQMASLQTMVMITGELDGVELTEYLLRWANPKSS